MQVGLNARVGASYLMAMNLEGGIHIGTSSRLLGIQILFRL
jgi:hypothetical protein